MYRVMLSYPLFGSGMRRLEQETDLFVTGCGELAPYEAQFLQADAFITRNVHPDKALIAKTTKLKVIGIPGVGYQGYDLEDLTNRGIALVYCPGMNGRSVAEHAMGLVYALTKQAVRRQSCSGAAAWRSGSTTPLPSPSRRRRLAAGTVRHSMSSWKT